MKQNSDLLFILACIALLFTVLASGCAPTPVIDNAICDQPAFADSLICQRLRANGIEAEQARDILLDANAIALITDVYTSEQLIEKLDDWEMYLDQVDASYVLFYLKVVDDTKKAKQVAGILQRRLPAFNSANVLRDSDRILLEAMINELRDSVGGDG